MVKKLFAQLALGMMIGLILMPVVLAAEPTEPVAPPIAGEAERLLILGNPWNTDNTNPTGDIEPCIQEQVQNPKDPAKRVPGPDDGYVITIMEEPLNIKEVGKTKTETATKGIYEGGDDYVVRRCFRNTFQYTEAIIKGAPPKIVDYKHHTLPMLADKCSGNAQGLMTTYNDKTMQLDTLRNYSVKYSCKEVQVILTKGGASAIYGYINMIYRWGASLVGIIAVTIIIGSGIQISASGGEQEAISAAKKRIVQSIVGILVLFLSSLILYTINPTFFTM